MNGNVSRTQKTPGILYVVATPIGNLEDLSPRALAVLKQVDQIACEDTRHTGKLLSHFGIRTPTTSYHEHNEKEKAKVLARRLLQGATLALVSDAGTPLLSDPGYRLVQACREQQIGVVPIPGPFAAAAALSVSGLPTDSFYFAGFPPRRRGALQRQLKQVAQLEATLVFYLPPRELKHSLSVMTAELGDRRAFLIREMTKLHETSYQGTLSRVVEQLGKEAARGEFTLVVEGARQIRPLEGTIDAGAYVAGLMQLRSMSRTEAVRQASGQLKMSRSQVYRLSFEETE